MIKRLFFWSVPVVALAVALFLAFRPQPELVDLVPVTRGPLIVTVDEEGQTRVHDVFTVSAPIAGRLLRPTLHVGDEVVAGKTVVARIEPADPALLDPRAQAQAEAAVRAAEAAAQLARAERKRAEADQEFAATDVKRMRELHTKGVVPKQSIDDSERRHRTATASVDAAEAAILMREHQLTVARAALMPPTALSDRSGCACVDMLAPVSGEVLTLITKSEAVVQVGAPLLELGDPATIEVVADYLSTDAVMLRPGQRAMIDGWGGDASVAAVVRRIEPSGFTKVSALGIEEQRVNVILDLTDPRSRWQRLGHAYRVEVHVVVWESDAVDIVPLTALFRHRDGWALFVDERGVARLRKVSIGQRSGLEVEVVDGVAVGAQVVANPSERIEDGTPIQSRHRRP